MTHAPGASAETPVASGPPQTVRTSFPLLVVIVAHLAFVVHAARLEPTTYVSRAIDAFGHSDADATAVGTTDPTAPQVSLAASPTLLWPPNHTLVSVTISMAAAHARGPNPTLRLASITSSEGDLANRSGHSSPDIQGAQFGTDDRQFLLRAERTPFGPGRVYTITYEAEDAKGHLTTGQVTVTVP